jgi:SAM-dependent methyltransferase
VNVRAAVAADLAEVVALRAGLWPDTPAGVHREEVGATLAGLSRSTLPVVILVAEDEGRLIGFVEVGLRSHADGCDPSRPCGYVEGWYVAPSHAGGGVGRLLVERAEDWAREQGCTEIASAVGTSGSAPATHYGVDLARVHHEHFGALARAAAQELLERLSRAGLASGRIVDLAAGSGIMSRLLVEAGFDVLGVDISEDMLAIARAEAGAARFVASSLWRVEVPPCVAVAAVGEAFSYAADPAASTAALEDRLAAIQDALAPGGLLLFDVAGPGRSGPDGSRSGFWTRGPVHLGLEEQEDRAGRRLTRAISLFLPDGDRRHRHVQETHVLHLYAPEDVEAALSRVGLRWERLDRYGAHAFPAGWHAYAGTKAGS